MPLHLLRRSSLASAALVLGCLTTTVDDAPGLVSHALTPPETRPAGAPTFSKLSAADTGIDAVNRYDDPAMWGILYREFAFGSVGTGVAIGDVDNDGLPDVLIINKTGPNRLYRNLGDFSRGRAVGVRVPERVRKAGDAQPRSTGGRPAENLCLTPTKRIP